ncbi:4'-phosphopantetheinyl transferase family protein [Parabacteroides bouchesdurhonensis]|uniref:4'-phosphopantetheinyl transferase family protein n=1 Tax=Parabacteroides bouchesdurhonensis TaxID=1936995 RepID=UPI000C83C25D|nr:4'-phosphopantetheinyl transferase superfamily protein [Parabacteroides bouchesdurhonensis]
MPLLQKYSNPLRGIWLMSESSDELLSMLDNVIDYQPFLHTIKTEHRRKEWLASRVLLKELLGQEVRVEYYPDGAPFLPDIPLHISISHTNNYAVVLLQESPAAGIDIEYKSDRVRKIRSRFMNPEEEINIDTAHETNHLLIYWCAKETLFKMIGQDNVDFCQHLHVKPFPYSESGVFTVQETRTQERTSFQLGYLVTPDFILTWSLPAQ